MRRLAPPSGRMSTAVTSAASRRVGRSTDACFIVRDANRQALAYVYFEEEPGRRAAAKLLTRDGPAHCQQCGEATGAAAPFNMGASNDVNECAMGGTDGDDSGSAGARAPRPPAPARGPAYRLR